MARNKKQRQSVGLRKTPRKPTCHTPRVTKPRVIDLSGRKRRKHANLVRKGDLISKQVLQERKRQTANNNNNKSKSSPSRHFILYPPVPPPPPPTARATTSSKSNRKSAAAQQKKYDTIVIDSEDESFSADKAEAIPSFYEDRTGGFDDKEVPQYNCHNSLDDVQLLEESLEEGEIREDLNKTIVNVEEIAIADDDDDSVAVIEPTVPLPKCEDQSVIFCSEVIDLSRADDRNKLLDYIPIGYDPDPAEGAKQRSPRKKKDKKHLREDKQTEQKEQPERSEPSKQVPRSAKRMVVIDGNNVAYAHTFGQAFSVKGLEICIQYFKKMGHNVKAVVPQFRLKKDKSTDQKLLEDLYKAGDVLLAPSKNLPGQRSSSYDDRLIISVAETFDGVIISNDNFRDLLTESDSWKKIIETRVVGYTWVMDAFFLPDDPYGRHGPKLKDLLECKEPAGGAAKAK